MSQRQIDRQITRPADSSYCSSLTWAASYVQDNIILTDASQQCYSHDDAQMMSQEELITLKRRRAGRSHHNDSRKISSSELIIYHHHLHHHSRRSTETHRLLLLTQIQDSLDLMMITAGTLTITIDSKVDSCSVNQVHRRSQSSISKLQVLIGVPQHRRSFIYKPVDG